MILPVFCNLGVISHNMKSMSRDSYLKQYCIAFSYRLTQLLMSSPLALACAPVAVAPSCFPVRFIYNMATSVAYPD